ncbi:MAG: ATP-dependent helicase [Bacillota bacterium]
MQLLLDQLNPKQKEAAQTLEGPVLVLAGAGSGKTRTLTYRTANLIKKGIKAENILTVTFTNRAANDMENKIVDLLGDEKIKDMWLGTFHSICLRILRDNLDKIDRIEGCLIYDNNDSIAIVEDIVFEFGLDDEEYNPKIVYNIISRAKMDLVNSDELVSRYAKEDNQGSQLYYRNVTRIYKEYERILINNNSFDFNDLIKKTIELFQQYPDILTRYQDIFKYIQVDEYQDVNHAQYQLTNMLAQPEDNIFIVGDDWQGIYGFRGADITNILEFEKDYPQAKVIKLERNYRSSNNIITVSNELIKNNTQNKVKKAWTEAGDGAPIYIARASTPRVEAKYVCKRINNIVRHYDYDYQDIAVLCRTHYQSHNIQNQLPKYQIPHQLVGGISFFDRQEIRYFVNYLKLLVNPNDKLALKRLFKIEVDGVGEILLSEINKYARNNNLEITDVFGNPSVVKGIGEKKASNIIEFKLRVIDRIFELKNIRMSMYDKVLDLYESIEFEKNVITNLDNPEKRKKYINLFLEDIYEFKKYNPQKSLYDYLLLNKLIMDQDLMEDNNEDTVKVMTAHSAKGLEFPIVFIIAAEEEVFPHLKSMEAKSSGKNDYAIQEERRLFYVAMTRAQKLLFISFSQKRTGNNEGQLKNIMPSRFLAELPRERLEFIRVVEAKAGRRLDFKKDDTIIENN